MLPNIKAKMIEEHGICQAQVRKKGRSQGKGKQEPRVKEAMFKASDKSRKADDPGTLGGIAAMMLMTVLYAARVASPCSKIRLAESHCILGQKDNKVGLPM